ncbi:MAG: hypothetical protein K6A77_11605 [Clostridiales bacterium]|nr:hypothetical protein [Clostridiales bacterium]
MSTEIKEQLKEIEIIGQVGKYRQDVVTEAMELSMEMLEEMNRRKLKEAVKKPEADSAAQLLMPAK